MENLLYIVTGTLLFAAAAFMIADWFGCCSCGDDDDINNPENNDNFYC